MKEEDRSDAIDSNDAIDRRHHHSSSSSSSESLSSTSTTKSTSKVLASTSISSNSKHSSKVSSSTNGSTSGVISSQPLRGRARATASAVDLVRAQIYGNALVTIGTDLVSAAAAAASGLPFASTTTASSEHNRILMQELVANVTHTARNVSAAVSSVMSSQHNSGSSGSDGSNGSAIGSPLLAITCSNKTGPKPRAADSPGSGSTTSTTTVVSTGTGVGMGGVVSVGVGGGGVGGHRDKVFVCNVCNRCFGYKHVLQNHERTHTGEKPFECRECHKRFTRDHHLKTHMRLHTGEKPYHCTHCERQFVQVANLRRHLRVHTGERPYACELCTSKFSDSNQLKAHMLIHKGEKPFECKKCLGRFRRRHHLMHHKCPKDEENIGKPRRGRRPKAYDALPTLAPQQCSSLVSAVSSSTAALAAAATSSHQFQSDVESFTSQVYHRLSSPTTHASSHDLEYGSLVSPPIAHSGARDSTSTVESSTLAITSAVQSKSRRKPRQTIRILTAREVSTHHDVTPALLSSSQASQASIQTQPLNLSLSPSLQVSSVIVPRGAHHHHFPHLHHHHHHHLHHPDDVLDLSRSRSDDSEAEPIEEEVEDEDEDEDDDVYGDVVGRYERQRRDETDQKRAHHMIAMIGAQSEDENEETNGTQTAISLTIKKELN